MKQKTDLSSQDYGKLLGVSSFLFGSVLRLFPVFLAGFPINDGGLFFSMTRALQANGYKLPQVVRYNGLDIPLAYPPLGFYLAGVTETWFRIPLLEVFRWLPAIVLIGSLFAFYALANQFLKSVEKAGLATLVFAFTPRSIEWMIMGGGITRSLGQLFFILTVYFTLRLFEERPRKMLGTVIVSGALVALAHPEATIHAVAVCLLLLIFKGRDREGLLRALACAVGVIALTAIWWLPVLHRFGLPPFISASQTGLHNTFGSLYFLSNFSEEPAITFALVLAFLGIAVSILKRDCLLPVFFILPFFIEPRNAANISVIPMSLLAAIGFFDVILRGLRNEQANQQAALPKKSLYLTTAFLGLYLGIGMLYFGTSISQERVAPGDLAAFEWIKANTAAESRFIVITGETDVFRDWTQEWFPALTERISATTIQGQEWIIGKEFLTRVNIFREIQGCSNASRALNCIETLAASSGIEYDYIYISVKASVSSDLASGIHLISELRDNPSYIPVYETDDVAIFMHAR